MTTATIAAAIIFSIDKATEDGLYDLNMVDFSRAATKNGILNMNVFIGSYRTRPAAMGAMLDYADANDIETFDLA